MYLTKAQISALYALRDAAPLEISRSIDGQLSVQQTHEWMISATGSTKKCAK